MCAFLAGLQAFAPAQKDVRVCATVARRDYGGVTCQSLSSPYLERFVSEAVLNALSSASVALSFEALRQAETDRAAAHEQWKLRFERAGRDAADARRAYRAVDPANRLVAQTLEDNREAALCAERRLRDGCERFRRRTPPVLSVRERGAIEAAASGIAALWNDGVLSKSEKAGILRLMIERVTVSMVGERASRSRWCGTEVCAAMPGSAAPSAAFRS